MNGRISLASPGGSPERHHGLISSGSDLVHGVRHVLDRNSILAQRADLETLINFLKYSSLDATDDAYENTARTVWATTVAEFLDPAYYGDDFKKALIQLDPDKQGLAVRLICELGGTGEPHREIHLPPLVDQMWNKLRNDGKADFLAVLQGAKVPKRIGDKFPPEVQQVMFLTQEVPHQISGGLSVWEQRFGLNGF